MRKKGEICKKCGTETFKRFLPAVNDYLDMCIKCDSGIIEMDKRLMEYGV